MCAHASVFMCKCVKVRPFSVVNHMACDFTSLADKVRSLALIIWDLNGPSDLLQVKIDQPLWSTLARPLYQSVVIAALPLKVISHRNGQTEAVFSLLFPFSLSVCADSVCVFVCVPYDY